MSEQGREVLRILFKYASQQQRDRINDTLLEKPPLTTNLDQQIAERRNAQSCLKDVKSRRLTISKQLSKTEQATLVRFFERFLTQSSSFVN